jgi:hypothetical protein
MPKSAEKISFDPKPLKAEGGWCIVVTYPSGMQEHIPGFHSEAETEEWLKGKTQSEAHSGRRAGVWSRIMNALATTHDASVQMIDTSIVRVHQHGACVTRNRRQSMGRSRGGLTSKIHAVVDTNGLPVQLA